MHKNGQTTSILGEGHAQILQPATSRNLSVIVQTYGTENLLERKAYNQRPVGHAARKDMDFGGHSSRFGEKLASNCYILMVEQFCSLGGRFFCRTLLPESW